MAARKTPARHIRVDDVPLLEWIVAAIGLLLVAGTAAYIAWQGYTRAGAAPDIALEAVEIRAIGGGYLVSIRATNNGGTTAKGVKVQGELARDGRVVESSEMSFDYLPPDSQRRGGLLFTADPRLHELKLSAKGYELP